MKIVKFKKHHLQDFLNNLHLFGELHAPQKKGDQSYVFDKVTDVSKIALSYTRTILPPKKYFFPQEQTLFTFSSDNGYETVRAEEEKRIVLFGVHPCDIHSIKILDLVFDGKYVDNYYFERKKNVIIIGIDCIPDELCFCLSMGTEHIEDGFDLFLSDIGDEYLVRIGTSLGDDIINSNKPFFDEVDKKAREKFKKYSKKRRGQFTTDVNIYDLPEIMDLEYESKVWQEAGEKCLGCGICSMVCPTCYCFDVYDQLNIDGISGERRRRWDSCLFVDYALVAGGFNFRGERSARIKNRHLHKQRAFVAEYGKPACTGCGRCIAACPANINIIDVISKLRS